MITKRYACATSHAVIEKINTTDRLSQQSTSVVLNIFSYLSVLEWLQNFEISRKWNRLTSHESLWNSLDLRETFPQLKIFDASDWLSVFKLTIETPPLDKLKTIQVIGKWFSSVLIEENMNATLLTMPEGLTFNDFLKIAESQGIFSNIGYVSDRIAESELGNTPIDNTYQVLLSNNILQGSRNLSVGEQVTFLKKRDCEMPNILEITVLLATLSSEECLYSNNLSTFTRCSEKLSGCSIVTGDFTSLGLYVYEADYTFDMIGVNGALRNF